MKRKLIWLNIALAGLIVAAGYKVRDEWSEEQRREQAVRANLVRPAPVKPVVVPPAPAPVTAGTYSDIANKMLFSQQRNPTVVVEVPAPPPPKPMPALPFLHGVMGLPSGMLALLSAKPDSRSVGVHVGEKIGEFELAALSQDEISFHWEDKTVTKSVSEMIYHTQEKAAAQPQQVAAVGAPPAAAAPKPSTPEKAKPAGEVPGLAGGIKNCTPGDTSPAGTEADGYRKVLKPTPFGNSCFWEPAK